MHRSRGSSSCPRRTSRPDTPAMRAAVATAVCAALALVGLGAAATSAHADTAVLRDGPGGPRGAFQIVSTRIDNTGPQVGIEVRHAGWRWQGRVTLKIDVVGGPAAEYVAGITHG